MNELRVGVIGIGHLGKEHARVYKGLRDVRLEAVADIDPSKAAIARALKVPFYEDYRELAGRVDAVSVAVPTSVHAPVAQFFLEAGCHTLVEKPMTDRLEDADRLLHVAQSNKLVLQVGHIERYNAAWMEVAQRVTRPGFIEVHRLGPFTPRIQDCGVVLDLMIHDLDILLSILKSPVESFEAVGLSVVTPHEDLANVRLKFADGCIVNLTASRLTPERQRKIRIFQENAYISVDYGAAQARIFTKEGSSITHREIRIEERDEPLKRELSAFVEAARAGGPRLDWPAREALALALSIERDIHANRKHLAVV